MCTTFVAKVILSIVNTLVLLVGLAMFVVGVLIHTEPSLSKDALSSVLKKLENSASTAGVTLDTSEFSAAEVAYSFTIAIICIGLFLAAISVLGLIGVKYSLKPVLVVYFLVTLILFLAQVTLLLIAAIDRSVFDDAIKPRLRTTIKDNFAGLDGEDATSQIWNGIMIYKQCCGVDDYLDFSDAKKWDKELNGQTPFIAPIACCKETPSSPPYTCALSPSDANSNWKTGCYTKIWDYLLTNSGIVIGVAVVVLGLQLIILILTCLVMNSMGKINDIV